MFFMVSISVVLSVVFLKKKSTTLLYNYFLTQVGKDITEVVPTKMPVLC